jgi:hypothetical protein
MSKPERPPERARRAWTRHWLGHCQGFRVEGPGGRVGTVECLIRRSLSEPPELLVVRAGRRSSRTLLVPADDVEKVLPREELVIVRGPTVVGTGFAA